MNIVAENVHKLYFDGCSKNNPGDAGIGIVIYKNDEEIVAECDYIGIKTNNEAEYNALILGLELAIENGIKILAVYGDSLLVINQMTNKYSVKNESLIRLYLKATELTKQFDYISFQHVYRKDNKRADYLSNVGLLKK